MSNAAVLLIIGIIAGALFLGLEGISKASVAKLAYALFFAAALVTLMNIGGLR